ncbi:MAG: ABC transporter permease subunit [Acidimicrobiales bacterium]
MTPDPTTTSAQPEPGPGGSTGATGPTDPTGATGPTGPARPVGADGPAAVRGSRGATPHRVGRGPVAALARQEALDGFRGRRALLVRMITPLLLFGVVLGAVLATRGPDPVRRDPYVVAVQGDRDGARAILGALAGDRLRFVPTDDAALAVLRGADLGLEVPDGLDATVAAGGDARVVVHRSATTSASRAALAVVRAGLTDQHLQLLQAQAAAVDPRQGQGLFPVELTDVQNTQQGTRTLGAELVPALLVLQAAMLVNGTATRLLGRRSRGLLPAQLVLPMRRDQLARAKGWAELAVGLVAGSPILLAVLVFTAWTTANRDGALAAAGDVIVVALSAVVLCLPMIGMGLLIGTAARTQEQVTLGTAAALVVSAMVAAFVALSDVAPPAGVAVVPVVGLVGTLRNLLTGTGGLGPVVVAMGTTLLLAWGATRLGGRLFDGERLVLRGA